MTKELDLLQTPKKNVDDGLQIIEKSITSAVESGNVEVLEKLLAMRDKEERIRRKNLYTKAMVNFMKNPPKITKNRKVEFKNVKYSHATLDRVVEKLRPALLQHGLSFQWIPSTSEQGKTCVTCRVTHEEGHFEESVLEAPPDNTGSKNSNQAIGSTLTYLQRYSLLSILGLVAEEDTDGVPKNVSITAEQVKQAKDIMRVLGVEEKKVLEWLEIERIEQMPESKWDMFSNGMEQKKRGKQ